MWKLKKILKIIAIFILGIIVLCVLYSVTMSIFYKNDNEETNILNSTLKYLLYTIGYGDISTNLVVQNTFATIGIISISLLSTFLTINLFWRIDDVKINKSILISKGNKNKYYATLLVWNMGADICRLEGSFIAYDNFGNAIVECSDKFNYPLLIKKSVWKIEIPIENTFLYEILRNMRKWKKNCKLYFTFSFVDTSTGQESIKVMEYSSDNIFAVSPENVCKVEIKKKQNWRLLNKLEKSKNLDDIFTKWLCGNTITYNLRDTKPIENGGKLSLYPDVLPLSEKEILEGAEEHEFLKAEVNFYKKRGEGDGLPFVMALLDFNSNPLDWSSHYSENGLFHVELSGSTEIDSLVVQIKYGESREKILDKTVSLTNARVTFDFSLQDMLNDKDVDAKVFTCIKEICFTVFSKNMTKLKGEFCIYHCEIEIPKLAMSAHFTNNH